MKFSDRVKFLIILLIASSCLIGFYFSMASTVSLYRLLLQPQNVFIGTFHYFANDMFKQQRHSDTIARIKQEIPEYSTVGFYSDLPYGYEYMMCCVLQNILAPILLDREKAGKHQYVIMFLGNKDPRQMTLQLHKTSFQYLGCNLFLVS